MRGCEDGDFWCALAHGRARAEEAWAPAPPAGTPTASACGVEAALHTAAARVWDQGGDGCQAAAAPQSATPADTTLPVTLGPSDASLHRGAAASSPLRTTAPSLVMPAMHSPEGGGIISDGRDARTPRGAAFGTLGSRAAALATSGEAGGAARIGGTAMSLPVERGALLLPAEPASLFAAYRTPSAFATVLAAEAHAIGHAGGIVSHHRKSGHHGKH